MSKSHEKLLERVIAGTAAALVAGYLGFAWAILHRRKPPEPPKPSRQ